MVFSQDFTGTILDAETKQTISNAQIYFVDIKAGTTTDFNGNFKIDRIKLKTVHIQISSPGYQTLNEFVNIDSSNNRTFQLEISPLELDEIAISDPTGRLQSENIVNIERKNMVELQLISTATLAEAISNIPDVEQGSYS
tara:strand:+ start:1126 stop:1545 length:420 start_codon:yes stop_codon:yes gene_type:complete